MRTAIVLSAGESRRMGTLKPLLPFGSGSVIGQVVRSLQASPIDAVLVVVGHRGAGVAAQLQEAIGGRRSAVGGEAVGSPASGHPLSAVSPAKTALDAGHRSHHLEASEVPIVHNPN